jgi:deoxyribodipyrimidine photo-lyase
MQHRVLSVDFHQSRLSDPMEKAVETWSLRAGVRVRPHAQFHPGMTAQSSESWQMLWERFMAQPRHEAPDELHAANVGIGTWPRENFEGELGGRKSAIQTLRRLFGGTVGIKDLPSGPDAFAALEPHLRLGVLSLREVWQAAVSAHQHALKSGMDIRAASIASFLQVLPDFIDSPNGQSRASQRARSTKATKPGHQFSLGLGESGA